MAKPLVREVLDLHRAQLQGVIELRGVRRMQKLYETARADIEERLADLRAAGRGQSFSAHHLRVILAQLTDGLRVFGDALSGHLENTGRLATLLSQRHLVNAVKKFEQRFTGHMPVLQVEQAAVLRGVLERVDSSLLDRYRKSVLFYTRPVVERVKLRLAQALVQNETVDRAVDMVAATDGVFAGERWRAERIVRTELSYAYGVTKQRTMEEMRTRDVPDLMKKLIATFDNRTGEDSEQLHGQIRHVHEPFMWEKRTKFGTTRVEYMQPPNRPNDREVVIPWRAGWAESAITAPGGQGPGPVNPQTPAGLTP